MVCAKVFGEKEPFNDRSLTHGICESCFEEVRLKHENREVIETNKDQNWGNSQAKLA